MESTFRVSNLVSKRVLLFLFLFITTVFLRFSQLGYSDFYGDETKVLYLRKDVAASDFLLNQRKGPVQFLAAWSAEKIFGTFDEFTTRIPFALAGTLAVFALYYVVKLLFDEKIAYISAFLFSVNGFFIAFSRTIQYQSFLLLFGFLSILFTLLYFKGSSSTKQITLVKRLQASKLVFLNAHLAKIHLVCAGIFLALAYLSHWDAVFFDLVIGILLIQSYLRSKNRTKVLKEFLIYFSIPFLVIMGLFFVPYFTQGYFSEHVSGYMSRRVSGSTLLPNDSFLTYQVYNYSFAFLVPLTFVLSLLRKRLTSQKVLLLIWFIVPFILFELIFKNPGTHIYNYMIPVLILASVGFFEVYDCVTGFRKKLLTGFGIFILFSMIYTSAFVYVPNLNTGYPWNTISKEKESHQLFLYGFPYRASWQDIRTYFKNEGSQNWPKSFYTNDNVTIGKYYLYGVLSVKPSIPHQFPQYYIDVETNQEFREADGELLEFYEAVYEGDGFVVYKFVEEKTLGTHE